MNQKVGQSDQQDVLGLDTGLEALRRSSDFRGPVEPLGVHDHSEESNDHFASIYDGRGEQFETAVPFVRQGLDRGERCLYVAADSSREEILEAMRSRGIDVDAALESGALSILTKEETYLETGEFDRDAMLEFWEETLEQARDEDGYAGIRAAAEMTWALDSETDLDQLVEYEAMLNDLYKDDDYVVLCQYNRERFPATVVRDVIRTHPHLIQGDEVYQNVYYTPPEEYFGPDQPDREIDRMLGTLQERTEVKTELKDRQRCLRELNEITADPDLGFEEKLDALFNLGKEQFGLDIGGMVKVYREADQLEVEHVSDEHGDFKPGLEPPLSGTYCGAAFGADGPATITDPVTEGYDDGYAYQELGFEAYLGTHVEVDSDRDRLFFFTTAEPRDEGFSDAEKTFIELLSQWVKYELERRQREQELRERTDHLRALIETTPECIKTVAEDGTLLQMNPAGLGMVEADSETAVTGECVYDLIAPEHREKFRAFNEQVCRGEPGTLEFDIIGLEGTRRHMESHAAPLHRPDGSTVQVALTRDVTEQKEHEERLEWKTERLESFASMLAHELRNPVTIGQIYSQQLPAETDSGADSETDSSESEAVEYVTEAFDRIEDMIDVMLVLTRGSEAVGGSCSVDLADEARAAWDDVDAPDATLDVALDRTIQADETYVRHFFRNLLENAVQHDGADVTVTVGDFPSGFYVADDGDGIPPEERDAVFEAGYTTATDGGGTGLGLAFVRELADVYGWDCDVTENEDGGARFEFRNVDRDPSET